jgi:hypothetical protein
MTTSVVLCLILKLFLVLDKLRAKKTGQKLKLLSTTKSRDNFLFFAQVI